MPAPAPTRLTALDDDAAAGVASALLPPSRRQRASERAPAPVEHDDRHERDEETDADRRPRNLVVRRRGGDVPQRAGLQAPLREDELRERRANGERDRNSNARTASRSPETPLLHHTSAGGTPTPARSRAPERTTATPPATSDSGREVVERVPASVAEAMQRIHGADVRDTMVHRGESADRLAKQLQARAVTREGEVFVPSGQGSLDTGAGRGLLAHELTHMLQQRRFGGTAPLEHSPAGRLLEAQARMTEQHVEGQPAAPPPPPIETPAPQPDQAEDESARDAIRQAQDDMIASGFAVRMPDGSLVFPGAAAMTQPAVAGTVQRAPAVAAMTEEQPGPRRREEPDASGTTPVTSTPNMAMQPQADMPAPVAPAMAASPEPLAPLPGATPIQTLMVARAPVVVSMQPDAAPSAPSLEMPSSAVSASAPVQAAPPPRLPAPAPSSLAAPAEMSALAVPQPAPAADPENPALNLDDLARRLYDRVATRLRAELVVERERAGMLTDLR